MKGKKLLWLAGAAALAAVAVLAWLLMPRTNATQKAFLEKADRLKAAVVTDETAAALGDCPIEGVGHAVFLSASDGASRAKVYKGTGKTLSDAWDNAVRNTAKDMNRDAAAFRWLRADVVSSAWAANAMDVLKKGMEEQGMSGVKLWIATYGDDPLVYPIMEKMIEYDKPVLFHTFVKAVGQLRYETTSYHIGNIAERYPEAKIIMAHLGGEPYHGIRNVAKYKNVWIDHSGTLVGSNDLQHTIDLVGVDRVLFGSDMPITYAGAYGQVLEAKLTEEEREKIFWKNTAELFGEGF